MGPGETAKNRDGRRICQTHPRPAKATGAEGAPGAHPSSRESGWPPKGKGGAAGRERPGVEKGPDGRDSCSTLPSEVHRGACKCPELGEASNTATTSQSTPEGQLQPRGRTVTTANREAEAEGRTPASPAEVWSPVYAGRGGVMLTTADSVRADPDVANVLLKGLALPADMSAVDALSLDDNFVELHSCLVKVKISFSFQVRFSSRGFLLSIDLLLFCRRARPPRPCTKRLWRWPAPPGLPGRS